MKLINSKTKQEIKIGDTVTTFRGEKGKLTGGVPASPGKSGKVYVKMPNISFDCTFYPNVIGAEWVK